MTGPPYGGAAPYASSSVKSSPACPSDTWQGRRASGAEARRGRTAPRAGTPRARARRLAAGADSRVAPQPLVRRTRPPEGLPLFCIVPVGLPSRVSQSAALRSQSCGSTALPSCCPVRTQRSRGHRRGEGAPAPQLPYQVRIGPRALARRRRPLPSCSLPGLRVVRNPLRPGEGPVVLQSPDRDRADVSCTVNSTGSSLQTGVTV